MSLLLQALLFALLTACVGCGGLPGVPLPNESTEPVDADRFELLARLVHITDAHATDEESPGRLTAVAGLSSSAWRPQEAYSTQLLDGIIRTVNKLHVARHTIDFVVHTGDATDNAQLNEMDWFITVLQGGRIDPLTGPDDRDPAVRPDPLLDPHEPFTAQGLYRNGVHGAAPTIEWYNLFGNHNRFALGVLPIVTDLLGRRISPLPLENRVGVFLPVELDPTGRLAWAPITPANPGPPPELNFPVLVQPNPDRRFITDRDFIEAHLAGTGEPTGHGFDPDHPNRTWYSVSPVPGLRLIGLNSATPFIEVPTLVYSEGAISLPQVRFLQRELTSAQALGEYVIVATHHPSGALDPTSGTALTPRAFHRMLNGYSCVKLHIAGHWHRNLVIDRGGYIEIVTSSIIDPPQQGRIIEIWRPTEPRAKWNPDLSGARADLPAEGEEIELRYWMFSHLDEIEPLDDSHADIFDDPLLPMRRIAAELTVTPK
ncbi:MAG: metallophosphoesterase [Phycisphaerales bacterium]|nr:MAG: metallophosphoesterase [Phycisphaerales bacterium]